MMPVLLFICLLFSFSAFLENPIQAFGLNGPILGNSPKTEGWRKNEKNLGKKGFANSFFALPHKAGLCGAQKPVGFLWSSKKPGKNRVNWLKQQNSAFEPFEKRLAKTEKSLGKNQLWLYLA